MNSRGPSSTGNPQGRNLPPPFRFCHVRKENHFLPTRSLDGEVVLVGDRPVVSGSVYDIWRGLWLNRRLVALKVDRNANPRGTDPTHLQVALWRTLEHKNILELHGICHIDRTPNPRMYLVSPWMENQDAICYCRSMPSADRLRIVYDVAKGLQYIHALGILHGGVRGSNVLITDDGSAVLSDFTLSTTVNSEAVFTNPLQSPTMSRWLPPEAINAGRLSAQFDVYSWGMTTLEIFSLSPLFSKAKSVYDVSTQISIGESLPARVDYPAEAMTDEIWTLLEQCWKFEPTDRPQVSHLLEVIGKARKAKYNWPGEGRPPKEDETDSE